MINVEEILIQLANKRKLFHSEADFQHEFAWYLHLKFPEAKIRLEKPSGHNDKKEHIDIIMELERSFYAFELKYKKSGTKYSDNDEEFKLNADGAQDISRYDYIKDICRLEEFVARNPINSAGFAIMISNDDLYWKPSRSLVSKEFLLTDGAQLLKNKPLKWHSSTGAGTNKNRTKSLTLRNSYKLNWKLYARIYGNKKNDFKYLIVQIIN